MKDRTILLVEDDFLNRRLSKKTLAENGYRVFEAKNARETLQLLTNEKVDLVILDINLGENEQDGISLGQIIKDQFSVQFIYLTAYENPEIINRAVLTAPYSYLTKPFKSVDLIALVDIAIRQSELQKKLTTKIMVKDQDYNIELTTDEINYVESEGNYILVHTDQKTYNMRSTIKNLVELLPSREFIQIHRAYVVNKSKVQKWNNKRIVINGIEIPVSKTYLENID